MSSYTCCDLGEPSKNVRSLASLLKILSEPNRLRILCILQEDGERCVCELLEHIEGVSQSLLSHHIADLRNAELVTGEKRGLNVYYSLTDTGRIVTKTVLSLTKEGAKP